MEYNVLIAKPPNHPIPKTTLQIKWNPSDQNVIKLNTDGAIIQKPVRGGLRGVFRDHSGHLLKGYIKACALATPEQAELLAILYGLRVALEINTDSSIVSNMFSPGHLYSNNIVSECRLLMQELGQVTIKHIYREENRVADALAKEGARNSVFGNLHIMETIPQCAVKEMEADTQGPLFVRKISVCNLNNISQAMANLHVTNSGHLTALLPGPV